MHILKIFLGNFSPKYCRLVLARNVNCSVLSLYLLTPYETGKNVKQSPYRPGVAQRVPGS